MELQTRRMVFAMTGAAGGLAGAVAAAGRCSGAACGSCFSCAGMGLLLVGLALLNRKGGKRHERDTHFPRSGPVDTTPSG